MAAMDNQGEHWQDLFPAAPAVEKVNGFTMRTWYGFEVVLPHSLVTPDPNYVQTAPDAVGLQKRRVQSRRSVFDELATIGSGPITGSAIEALAAAAGSGSASAAGFQYPAAEQSNQQPPQAMTWRDVAAMAGTAIISHVASIINR